MSIHFCFVLGTSIMFYLEKQCKKVKERHPIHKLLAMVDLKCKFYILLCGSTDSDSFRLKWVSHFKGHMPSGETVLLPA